MCSLWFRAWQRFAQLHWGRSVVWPLVSILKQWIWLPSLCSFQASLPEYCEYHDPWFWGRLWVIDLLSFLVWRWLFDRGRRSFAGFTIWYLEIDGWCWERIRTGFYHHHESKCHFWERCKWHCTVVHEQPCLRRGPSAYSFIILNSCHAHIYNASI